MSNSAADEFREELLREVSELKDENDKLRQVQEQFWLLLFEREDLQRQLQELRSGANNVLGSNVTSGTVGNQITPNTTAAADVSVSAGFSPQELQQRRVEYDAMSTALQECLALVMTKEQQRTLNETELGARGPVHAFLSWLSFTAERSSAKQSLALARGGAVFSDGAGDGSLSPSAPKFMSAFSPTMSATASMLPGAAGSREEKEALLRELHRTKQELKQVQEELDRTDMSRLQALEDAERMQQQMEILSNGVRELRQAYEGVKLQAESSAKHAAMVQQLKSQLAARDATIHELRGKLSQVQRLGDIGSSELALDTARIRQQLAQRASSNTAQDIMLSP